MTATRDTTYPSEFVHVRYSRTCPSCDGLGRVSCLTPGTFGPVVWSTDCPTCGGIGALPGEGDFAC